LEGLEIGRRKVNSTRTRCMVEADVREESRVEV
jgi:hypothetical protein